MRTGRAAERSSGRASTRSWRRGRATPPTSASTPTTIGWPTCAGPPRRPTWTPRRASSATSRPSTRQASPSTPDSSVTWHCMAPACGTSRPRSYAAGSAARRPADEIGDALFLLLARDFAPLEERLESMTERLEAAPTALLQVRDRLGDRSGALLERAGGGGRGRPARAGPRDRHGRPGALAGRQSRGSSGWRRRLGPRVTRSSTTRPGSDRPSARLMVTSPSGARPSTSSSRCAPSTAWIRTPSWPSAGSSSRSFTAHARRPAAPSTHRSPRRRPWTASRRTSPPDLRGGPGGLPRRDAAGARASSRTTTWPPCRRTTPLEVMPTPEYLRSRHPLRGVLRAGRLRPAAPGHLHRHPVGGRRPGCHARAQLGVHRQHQHPRGLPGSPPAAVGGPGARPPLRACSSTRRSSSRAGACTASR